MAIPPFPRTTSVRLAAQEGRDVEKVLLVARRGEAVAGIERRQPRLLRLRCGGRPRLGAEPRAPDAGHPLEEAGTALLGKGWDRPAPILHRRRGVGIGCDDGCR